MSTRTEPPVTRPDGRQCTTSPSASAHKPAAPGQDSAHGIDRHQVLHIVEDFHLLRRQCEAAHQALADAHQITLTQLARAVEVKDGATGSHILRVGALSALVAGRMGQPKEWCRRIELAAPMHDIGKIGVPDHILKKPGPLTPAEHQIMETHSEMGARILGHSGVVVLEMAAEIALTHHERWDGRGYPSGLAGETIPLSGRIVGAVDFFDALTMDRCYREALGDDQALELLKAGRGTHFDPLVLDAILSIFGKLIAARDRINQEQGTNAG